MNRDAQQDHAPQPARDELLQVDPHGPGRQLLLGLLAEGRGDAQVGLGEDALALAEMLPHPLSSPTASSRDAVRHAG